MDPPHDSTFHLVWVDPLHRLVVCACYQQSLAVDLRVLVPQMR
jgi:hypothetical protein